MNTFLVSDLNVYSNFLRPDTTHLQQKVYISVKMSGATSFSWQTCFPFLLEFVVTHSMFIRARSQLTEKSKQRFKKCSRRVGHTLVNEEICQEKLSYGCTFLAGGPPVFINLGYMWGDVSHLSILCQPPDINISILIRSRNALKTLL